MRRSSRRSWPVLLLLTVLTVPITTGALLAQPQSASPSPHGGVAEPHDTADLYNSLRDVINYGADVFNKQADHPGCYRVYQGALISIRPFLTPETRKSIDESIARAEALPSPAERAFELRKTLDAIRAKSAPNRTAPPTLASANSGNVAIKNENTKVETPKGAVPRIGKVIIVGNAATKDDVILRAIGIYPGQPLNIAELRLAEKNLERLGIFEMSPEKGVKPTVTAVATADANIQDILVTVKEMAIGSLPKTDTPKVAVPTLDLPKITDTPKVDPPKVEAPKVDPPKVNPPTVDLPKVVPPTVDPPKIENKKKPEVPKVDPVPKADLPKVESPTIDLPKIDLPKVDEKKKPEAPKVVDPLKIELPGIDLPKPAPPKGNDPLKIELPGVVPPRTEGSKAELPIDPLRIEPPIVDLPAIAKKDGRAEQGEVSGKVVVDGKPVPPGFTVTLVSTLGKRYSTTVGHEGSYRFMPGIPAGKYRMAIEPAAGDAGRQTVVPGRYTNDTTSGLQFEVKTGPATLDVRLVK